MTNQKETALSIVFGRVTTKRDVIVLSLRTVDELFNSMKAKRYETVVRHADTW